MRVLPKSVFAAVLGLLMLVPAAASNSASAGQTYQANQPVKVLTYNIHHGAGIDGVLSLERIAAVIENSGAEVVGLQEVDKHYGARSNWVDQPAWLAQRLGMHVAYAANLDLPPVNVGEPRRQYGTAILSRYPIKTFRNTLLPKYAGQEQRGLAEATIWLRGKTLRFANTHLTNTNNAERLEQANRVKELLVPAQPIVLVGDFNAAPSAPEITTLTARWRDTWAEVGVGPGYTVPVQGPSARIDYILHSSKVRAVSARVISSQASDHLPVLAEVVMSR